MKKAFSKSLSWLLSVLMLFGVFVLAPVTVNAMNNPYPDINGNYPGNNSNCTWTAWEQAHIRGFDLPAWGNAKNWYAGAQNSGYPTGSTPRANSIVVYDAQSWNAWGHVAFVTDYDSSSGRIYIIEGNYNGAYHEGWASAYKSNILGYIYLGSNETKVDIGTNFYAYIMHNGKAVSQVDDNVVLSTLTGTQNQLWYFERTDDLYYKITNVGNFKVLDAAGQGTSNGTNIQTYESNDTNAQRWCFVKSGGNLNIIPKYSSNIALDLSNGNMADGTNIQIYERDGTFAQEYLLVTPTYTVSYNMNGGDGSIEKQTKTYGQDLTLSSTLPTRIDYKFIGWNTNKDATSAQYQPGGKYTANSGATLYAIWQKIDYNSAPTAKGFFNGNTYEYYSQRMNWDQAYKFCEKKGGHLVTINSKEENDFIVELTKSRSVNLWTGGKTSEYTTWYWITGEPFNYQNWDTGEPNNLDNVQDTLQLYLSGLWDDVGSTRSITLEFVCEYDNNINTSQYTPAYIAQYNGHEYYFFTNSVDWQTAKKICTAKGGYLAIPNNADENAFILSGVKQISKEEAWIGITDIAQEGVWKDVKGNSLTYTNWVSGEPNNYLNIEDYAHIYGDGTWNDTRGYVAISFNFGFVCEFDNLCTASGHKYTEKVVEPTVTEQGYTLHTCSVCGDSYKDNYTDKLFGHLVNNSTLSAETIELGEKITVTGKATGGMGEYQYNILYKQTAQSKWTTAQGYEANSTVTIKPNKATTYDVCVKVKDSNGTEVKKYFTVKVTDVLKNNSTLSKTAINLGDTITVNGKATGGTGSYQYNILYKQTAQSKWTTVQSYEENSTVTIKPTKATTYDVCVKVKGSNGTEVKKYFTVKVTDVLKNNSTLSKTEINLGSTITVNCKATGGLGSYQYNILYKQTAQSKWTTAQSYNENSTVKIEPTKATTYDICVKVKDSDGTEVKEYFTVNVTNNKLKNISTVSAETITLGESVTVNANATGSTGFYIYSVYYKKTSDTKWTTAQDFKANNKVIVNPAKATSYDICVKVKDDKGTVDKKYFTVNVVNKLKNVSTVSAKTINIGESVTVNANATGSTGLYTYAVYYKQETQTRWTIAQDFNANNKVTVNPIKATSYDICVKVKDDKGTVDKKYFTVNVVNKLKNVSTVSAKTINIGESVTVNANATGSTGLYTYAVYYKQETQTRWTIAQDFNANNKVTVNPIKATSYDICVKVKDDKGTVDKKYFKVNVTDFRNTSTISQTEITLGQKIEVNCSATGSTGFYQYAVYYKKTSNTKWTTKQNYSSNNTVTFKPTEATTYDICVEIKDNQDNIVKKYFEVTVK